MKNHKKTSSISDVCLNVFTKDSSYNGKDAFETDALVIHTTCT